MVRASPKKAVQRFSTLEAKVLMRVLDQDGDSRLSMNELHTVLSDLGMEEESIDDIMLHADQNHDDTVDFDEFLAAICQSWDLGLVKSVMSLATKSVQTNELLEQRSSAIEGLTADDFREMKALSRPPPSLLMLMTAVAILLQPPSTEVKDFEWNGIRKMLQSVQRFLRQLKNVVEVSDDTLEQALTYIEHPDFTEEKMSFISEACRRIYCWTKATVEYNQLLIISRKYNQMSKDEQKANATAIDAERKALDKESSAVFGSAANTMDEIGEIATQMEQIRQDMREKMALGKKNPTTLKEELELLRTRLSACKSQMGEALMQIDKDDLRRLSLIEGRPIAIEMVMACIKTIVSPDNCLPSDLTWTKTRTMLVQPAHATEVYEKLKSMDVEWPELPFKVAACSQYWKNPNFNFTFCANQNRTASHLCTWMQACVMASELMDGIRDFQRELYGDVSNTEAPPTEDCDEDEGEDSTKHDEHERFHSQANRMLVAATYHSMLTPADLKAVFDHYDADGDGLLSMEELSSMYSDILKAPVSTIMAGSDQKRIMDSTDAVVAMVAETTMHMLDKSHDNKLDWTEFVAWRESLVRNQIMLDAAYNEVKMVLSLMKRKDIEALSKKGQVEPEIQMTLKSVLTLLTPPDHVAVQATWKKAQEQISNVPIFLKRLSDVKMDEISESCLEKVEPYLHNENCQAEKVAAKNSVSGLLCRWVHGVVSYRRATDAINQDHVRKDEHQEAVASGTAAVEVNQVEIRKSRKKLDETVDALRPTGIDMILKLGDEVVPPPAVELVVAGCVVALSPPNSVVVDISWKQSLAALRKHASPDANALIEEIRTCSNEGLPEDHLYLLEPYIENPNFDPNTVIRKHGNLPALSNLCAWVRAEQEHLVLKYGLSKELGLAKAYAEQADEPAAA